MNKEKTGKLISAIRQQKNLTQQDVADKLHVTSKAVSKWERGLSFPSVDMLQPLSQVLGISVVDILSGEIATSQNINTLADQVSLHALQKRKKMKNVLIIAISMFAMILILFLVIGNGKVIFQRGNPLPYVIAMTKIREEAPYIEVEKNSGIYITKKGECPTLFTFIEKNRKVKFVEQIGSGYVFSNGLDSITVSSEIYWSKFTVWQVPQHTLQTK